MHGCCWGWGPLSTLDSAQTLDLKGTVSVWSTRSPLLRNVSTFTSNITTPDCLWCCTEVSSINRINAYAQTLLFQEFVLENTYIHKYKCTLPHMHAAGLSCPCSLRVVEAEGGWSVVKPKMFTCALHPVNRLYATLDVPAEKISCSQSWFGNYPIGHIELCQTCRSGHYGADLCCFSVTQSTDKCYFGESINIYGCIQACLFYGNTFLTSAPVYFHESNIFRKEVALKTVCLILE